MKPKNQADLNAAMRARALILATDALGNASMVEIADQVAAKLHDEFKSYITDAHVLPEQFLVMCETIAEAVSGRFYR